MRGARRQRPSADLVVRGGRVVLEDGVREADLVVREGRIDAIAPLGDGRGAELLDVRGLVVLPGLVDAHVHFNEPGRTEWEGWAAGTRGAAAGGVTTVLDMPLNSIPPTVDVAAFAAKRAAAERAAVVDFGLWGGIVSDDTGAMAALHHRGVVGFKAFLCDSGVAEFPPLDDATLQRALYAAADLGAVVGVHAEDSDVLARHARRGWVGSRPAEAELKAIARLVDLAGRTHASVHVLHVSSADALARVRASGRENEAARPRRCRAAPRLLGETLPQGQGPLGAKRSRPSFDVTAETCPHYLVFTQDDLATVGPLLKCAPPLRDEANRERLWRAVLEGAVDLIASDHSPCAPHLKQGDVARAWGGITGVQTTLPALLTEGVHRRGLALELLAALVATNPAKRFGLYPRKGAIRVGADADLAIVDLEHRWTFTREMLRARSGLSPYVGREFVGAVVGTLVRGRVVYAEGEILVRPGSGRLVARG